MGAARRWLDAVVTLIAVVCLVGMTLVVTADAVARSFLSSPIPRVLPMVQYWFMPVVVFAGFVLAQGADRHLRADLLFGRLPHIAQHGAVVAGALVSAALSFGFAWFGLRSADDARASERADAITGLATWPTTYLVPIATAALGLLFILAAVRAARGLSASQAPAEHESLTSLDEGAL